MNRREFLRALGIAAASGFPLSWNPTGAQAAPQMMYEVPRFGNVSLMFIADSHGQLLPTYLREPASHIGVGPHGNLPPHLVGESFLEYFRIMPESGRAYAHTHLNFADAARVFGRMGGYAHLATLLGWQRQQRPDAILLDGGDSWQGSALALWTRGGAMVEASRLLGLEAMTGDWEFAYGRERFKELVKAMGHGERFLACNVQAADGDSLPVQPAAVYFTHGGVVGVVGLACPHINRAAARQFAPGLEFSLDETVVQNAVDDVRRRGARVVVLLSHAGVMADIKLASRLSGVDIILSAHSHDAMPEPLMVGARGGHTLVCSAGANGKFIGLLDLKVEAGRLRDYRYRLLPVFSNLIPPDPEMSALIDKLRAPYASRLATELARTDELLYRRGNFGGTFDQVILEAMQRHTGADVVLSPGYRWGTTLLPGDVITTERLLDQTAVPAPEVVTKTMTGAELKHHLEVWCDGVFNTDPYQQTGEDMVRVGGVTYACDPVAGFGSRIQDLRQRGIPLDADQRLRVAAWGLGLSGQAGAPIWQITADYLQAMRVVRSVTPNLPGLIGMSDNRGLL